MDLLCDSGPRSSVRLQSRCWPGLQSSEGLTEAGGFDSKMATHMALAEGLSSLLTVAGGRP